MNAIWERKQELWAEGDSESSGMGGRLLAMEGDEDAVDDERAEARAMQRLAQAITEQTAMPRGLEEQDTANTELLQVSCVTAAAIFVAWVRLVYLTGGDEFMFSSSWPTSRIWCFRRPWAFCYAALARLQRRHLTSPSWRRTWSVGAHARRMQRSGTLARKSGVRAIGRRLWRC